MEVMLITSQHLDSAFSKLHKYTSFAARNYTTRPEVLDNVSPTLRRSLQLLKVNRSDLFDDALSVLSSTRSSAISNMFVEALTRGVDAGAGGGAAGKGKDALAARTLLGFCQEAFVYALRPTWSMHYLTKVQEVEAGRYRGEKVSRLLLVYQSLSIQRDFPRTHARQPWLDGPMLVYLLHSV